MEWLIYIGGDGLGDRLGNGFQTQWTLHRLGFVSLPPSFCIGQESNSESVALSEFGHVFKPWYENKSSGIFENINGWRDSPWHIVLYWDIWLQSSSNIVCNDFNNFSRNLDSTLSIKLNKKQNKMYFTIDIFRWRSDKCTCYVTEHA